MEETKLTATEILFDIHGRLAKLPIGMDLYQPISTLLLQVKEQTAEKDREIDKLKIQVEGLKTIGQERLDEKDREIESLRKEIYQLREGKSGAVGLKIYGINKSLESQLSEMAKALEEKEASIKKWEQDYSDLQHRNIFLKERLSKKNHL